MAASLTHVAARAVAAAASFRPGLCRSSRTLRSVTSAAVAAAPRSGLATFTSGEYGEFPGGKRIRLVTTMDDHNPDAREPLPVYRVMDEDGSIRPGARAPDLGKDTLLEAYTYMLKLQALDTVFYDAQRQGRISFYMQNSGEEGTQIGSAMALQNTDPVYAQYREAGVLLWRGFTLQMMADQCFSNKDDLGKGRQMPVHYGSAALNVPTISSPLATQIPQATGSAYALKNTGRCTICYFGEGAASEGDFHAAVNMASTLGGPIIFFCRNNGFAISTPVEDQYRGDGIAARGIAYGIHTIRVDGNDLFAVREATLHARKLAVEENRPVLIEAMSYREGHHSTSDDSTRYRSPDEIADWRQRSNPILRLRAYLIGQGWLTEEEDQAILKAERKSVLKALSAAENKPKPDISELFTDVYAQKPWHLKEQEEQMHAHMLKHPEHYTQGH